MYSISEFTELGAGGCHIGQCRSRRKGGHEETNSGKEPGATYEMILGLLPADIWHWHVRTFSLTSVVPDALTRVFSPAGLFWSSTTPCPGSRATRPPRTVPPAFPSTLWCSLSCTTPSWIYSNWKSTCSLWLSSFSPQPQSKEPATLFKYLTPSSWDHSAVLHCDYFSAGTCHFCSVHYQSDSQTLLSWTWKLP